MKNFHLCRVIGLTGKKGSGKSAFASFLKKELEQQGHRVEVWGFATKLKQEVIELFKGDCPYSDPDEFFTPELKASYPSVRKLLQNWGDWRKTQDPDYWTTAWLTCAKNFIDLWNYNDSIAEDWMEREDLEVELAQKRYIIIPDLRFLNENNTLFSCFGGRYTSVRIIGTDTDTVDTHNSEVEQAKIPAYFEIMNTATLDMLRDEARRFTLELT